MHIFPSQYWLTTRTDFLFLQYFSPLPLLRCHNSTKVEQRPLWHVPRLPETLLWIYSCLSYQAKNTWTRLLSRVPVSRPGKFHTPHRGQHFIKNIRQLFAVPDPLFEELHVIIGFFVIIGLVLVCFLVINPKCQCILLLNGAIYKRNTLTCGELHELNMWVALVKMCHVAVVIDCCFWPSETPWVLTIRCLIGTRLQRNIAFSIACSCWIVGSKCAEDKGADALIAALSYSFMLGEGGHGGISFTGKTVRD